MLTEPSINQLSVKTKLEEEYGLKLAKLTFIPKGECSWGYILEDENKQKSFLKIYPNLSVPETAFILTNDLFEKAGIKNIIHTYKTKTGGVRVRIDTFQMALFNYVYGKDGNEQPLTDAHLQQLGKLLKRIHQANSRVGEYPIREDFSIPKKDDFIQIISDFGRLPMEIGKEARELRDFIILHKLELFEEYKKLEESRSKLLGLNLPFVTCHGDPTPGNIRVGVDGEIYLIDWDDPIFAPKEKDLFFFADPKYQSVLASYEEAGNLEINQEVVDFYRHKWNITEIIDYGNRFLYSNMSEVQKRHDLEELRKTLKEMR
ncbi:MAG: phosphotransferase [bacterium]|nr:phosphotransferase [bacterium]